MTAKITPADALTSQSSGVALSERPVSTPSGNTSASRTLDTSTGLKKTPSPTPLNLPVMNTLMAADRTLMSWTRTSLSLLSFGFTIYKILEGFQDAGGKFVVRSDVPRNAGLFLVGMGTFAMLMGTLEYWQTLRVLDQKRIFGRPRSPLIMALIMSASGALLLLSITVKVL
jgi:putative membrane protein